MSEDQDQCQVCRLQKFKYTCPKCGLLYCSVACYKDVGHLRCSEAFYKSCIKEQIEVDKSINTNAMKEILERMRKEDEGTPFSMPLDSDDDSCGEEAVEEEEEKDLAERLENIDLNDCDAVWKCLNEKERKEFLQLTETGEINKILPKFKAWWETQNTKIIDLSVKKDVPDIITIIPKFSSLCQKAPAATVHYNIWNILAAYSCVVRYFRGEPQLDAFEAVSHIYNLSICLKYGAHFEDAESAVMSVATEASTTPNMPDGTKYCILESPERLQSDVRSLMSNVNSKLAALSDILRLLQTAKLQVKNAKKDARESQISLNLSIGCEVLDVKKLYQLIKRFEFLLSYVNRENEEAL